MTTIPLTETAPSNYTVRRFEPADAPSVTECVRRIYGDTYIHQALYDPEEVIRLNETGEQVSIVALDAAGQIVGHYAIERPQRGPIAETGEAVVLPEHQHHHLLERMATVLLEQARQLDLTGLFGQPVTNHVFSQKLYKHRDAFPCGVNLGQLPQTFHNLSQPLTQRLSSLLYFQYLRQPAAVVVHASAHHQPMLERIYRPFRLPVEFREAQAPAGSGKIRVSMDSSLQSGVIRVPSCGANSASQIQFAYYDLLSTWGVDYILLELPLAQPGTPDLCQTAEELGFFFSGVGPAFAADGDVLRLQYLNVPLDVAQLQIEDAFARELVDYVASERQRVGGDSSS